MYVPCSHVQVYGWEPAVTYDVLALQWGKVSDMAISGEQLVSRGRDTCSLVHRPLFPARVIHTTVGMHGQVLLGIARAGNETSWRWGEREREMASLISFLGSCRR